MERVQQLAVDENAEKWVGRLGNDIIYTVK